MIFVVCEASDQGSGQILDSELLKRPLHTPELMSDPCVSLVFAKYLYEIKQHQRKHVIYGCHVFSEPVHDPAWKEKEM